MLDLNLTSIFYDSLKYFDRNLVRVCARMHVCVPGVQMHVCNREHYGFLPVPLKPQQNGKDESESFIHTITEALSE